MVCVLHFVILISSMWMKARALEFFHFNKQTTLKVKERWNFTLIRFSIPGVRLKCNFTGLPLFIRWPSLSKHKEHC